MKNFEIKNIKKEHTLSIANVNASMELKINFNQAEDVLTIPLESRHNHKCGFATQSGRSMIEMLGVLAIIGVLSVGGIAGYSKAMMKYRINKTIEQITLIAGNIRTFFAPQRKYDGVNDLTILRKAKLVPDEMWSVCKKNSGNGDELEDCLNNANAFDGNLIIGGGERSFYLGFSGIPEEACIELISKDWINANVDSITLALAGNGIIYLDMPVAVDTAIEKCDALYQAAASIPVANVQEIMFYFR